MHWLLRRPGPNPSDVSLHLVVATGVSRRADLVKQAHGAQIRILGQPSPNDPLVRIELRRARSPRSVLDRLVIQLPVQLSRCNPAVHRPPAHTNLPRDRGLVRTLLQVVPQKHSRLSPDHRVSSVWWRRHRSQARPGGSFQTRPPTPQPPSCPQPGGRFVDAEGTRAGAGTPGPGRWRARRRGTGVGGGMGAGFVPGGRGESGTPTTVLRGVPSLQD